MSNAFRVRPGGGGTFAEVDAALARLLKKRGYRPLVAACDIYRPAAIDQLEILARQEEIAFYADRESKDSTNWATAPPVWKPD